MKKTLISRLAAAVGGLALLLMPLLAAPPPGVLNHQGRLVVNGENYTGTGHFKFALVDAAGTARYWSNDGTGSGGGPPTAAVQAAVSEGHYALGLGDATLANMTAIPASVFADNADVRLRVWVSTNGTAFEQLAPDRRLTSAGYALSAATVAEPGVARLAGNQTFTGSITAAGFTGSGTGLTGVAKLAGSQTIDGTLTATGFVGSGAGLTGIPQLSGNNTFTGSITAAGFTGSGAGLTGVAKLAGNQTIDGTLTATGFVGSGAGLTGIPRLAGNNTFTGTLTATNFIGSGAGLTGLPQLAGGNAFTGNQTVGGTVSATGFAGSGAGLTGVALLGGNNTFSGTLTAPNFIGSGAGLTGIPQLSGNNTFTGTNSFSGNQTFGGTVSATGFTGSGAGLTGVAKLAGNQTIDGVLTADGFVGSGAGLAGVAKLGANAFTGNQTVSGTVTATVFNGSGAGLTSLPKLTGDNFFTGTQTVDGSQRVGGSVFVDLAGANSGALFNQPSLIFGPGNSGEGIASKRTSGGNQYGLDFYTNYTSRMSIAGSGNVTMTGTCSALAFIPTSDRNAKENFTPVDPREVLDKVAALPLTRWNFKNDAATAPHLGPMAQDFHAAFGLGTDDRHIATVDADGVALAAIQGLNQKLEEEVRTLRADKNAQLSALHGENASLKTENDALKERLARLEKAVATLAAARETTPPAAPVAVATTATGGTAQ